MACSCRWVRSWRIWISISAARPRNSAMEARSSPISPLEAGLLPLQGEEAVELREALVVELLLAREFLVDQVRLAGEGVDLGLRAGDLLPDLGLALSQLPGLPFERGDAGLEQGALAVDDGGDLGVGPRTGQQVRVEGDLVAAVLLGLQPVAAGGELPGLVLEDLRLGAGQGVVEAQQDVSGLHALAVADQDLAHHAAIGVLDDLLAGLDLDLAGGDDGAGDVGEGRPAAEADHEEEEAEDPDGERPARGEARGDGGRVGGGDAGGRREGRETRASAARGRHGRRARGGRGSWRWGGAATEDRLPRRGRGGFGREGGAGRLRRGGGAGRLGLRGGAAARALRIEPRNARG